MKSQPKLEKTKSAKPTGPSFQDLLLQLEKFWADRDCVLQQPYDVEVGAGTMHPETFLRVLGPDLTVSPTSSRAVGPPTGATEKIPIASISITSFK